MSSVYYPKPRNIERWTGKPRLPNETCRKLSYREGQAHECGEPTENGATYCGLCKRHLITLTDRKSPEQPAPKPFHWATDQILPRKRA
jgi:hypothetical protein